MLIQTTKRRAPAFPLFTLVIVAACLLVAGWQTQLTPEQELALSQRWGAVPSVLFRDGPGLAELGRLVRLVTALFVHADWAHLTGNLAYLLLFGIAVERALGSARFLLLYLACGSLANLAAAWQLGQAAAPVIGSSGAVSAVIGAYLVLFPRARMGVLLPLGLFVQFLHVPVFLVIGSWVALQLIYTWMGPAIGPVAWWAHVAGFAAGMLATLPAGPGSGDQRLRK